MYEPLHIDQAVNTLTQTIQEAIESSIPTKTIRIDRPPLPNALVQIIRKKRRVYRQFVRTRDPGIKLQWNRLNAVVRRAVIKHKEDTWSKACANLDPSNGAAFWKKFKTLTGQLSNPKRHLHVTDQIITTNNEKANIFSNQMEQVYRHPEDPLFDNAHANTIGAEIARHRANPARIMPLKPHITDADVSEAIANTKKSTSPGEDGITFTHIKHLPAAAITFLSKILTFCITVGYHPSRWRHAIIIMIPKPGKPPTNSESQRPISLLNTLGKIHERIFHNRIFTTCITKNLIPQHQYGHLVRAITAFLHNRTASIRIGNNLSTPFPIQTGVPQGSVLSPLLFLLYCHDLPTPGRPLTSQEQYADDTAIFAIGKIPRQATASLQRQLNVLENWMRRWCIKPNPGKTQFLLFRHRHAKTKDKYEHLHLELWHGRVQPIHSATYLEIHLTETLYWKPDIQKCAKRMHQRMSLITSLRGRLRGCNMKVQIYTYKTFVRPIVDFSATIYAGIRTSLIQSDLRNRDSCAGCMAYHGDHQQQTFTSWPASNQSLPDYSTYNSDSPADASGEKQPVPQHSGPDPHASTADAHASNTTTPSSSTPSSQQPTTGSGRHFRKYPTLPTITTRKHAHSLQCHAKHKHTSSIR
ncbi:hypothetical protein CBL_05116 [Carabus blaptoides fortunei]